MPKPEVTYYEGPGQLKKTTCRIYLVLVTNAVVSRDHNIFLGDLEFEGVDPLSLSEFENGLWENSRVSGEKEYYKNGKKLESSIPTDIVNYLDSNYDYIEAEKQFRELIADVSKPLEYKDDKSKGGSNKKKSFWGKRTRKEERKGIVLAKSEEAKKFGVNEEVLSWAKKDALLLHPGPVNRNVELSYTVVDGDQSFINEQVTNGVAVRMAAMYLLNQAKRA